MEKSANRAAADGRRRLRRAEAMHSRAIEREIVRHEREQERERVRAEREVERRRITGERERAAQQKQEAKEAQLRAWQLEYEEHQEREQDIDGIANEAPEVEDRDRLYAELTERSAFEPRAFVPPIPPNSEAKARQLRKQAEGEVETALAAFRPETQRIRIGQMIAAAVGLGGFGLSFAEAVADPTIARVAILIGIAGVIIAQFVATSESKRQRGVLEKKLGQDAQGRLKESLDALTREDEAQAHAALQKARAAYDAETETARAEFERDEDERVQALSELQAGGIDRMRETMEGVLPLELPVPCAVSFDVRSSNVVALEIDVPEPSVLPTTEAKLLASGKISHKEKNEKRLREQYLRLVAGLALRHAAEAMLNLPTCQRVELRAFRTAVDPSLGRPTRQRVLDVSFDYPTLAPMTMDGIDPVAALKHFQYRINIDRNRNLQALEAS